MSKYFNHREKVKKKYRSQALKQREAIEAEKKKLLSKTRKQQAIEKAIKEAWLASPDGQAAVAKVKAANPHSVLKHGEAELS